MSGTTSSHLYCSNCHEAYDARHIYCAKCGYILPHIEEELTQHFGPVATHSADLQWGTSYFHHRAKLYLEIERAESLVHVPLTQGIAILGRHNQDSNPTNLVDLNLHGALALGVSRSHAKIILENSLLQISDLNSSNGTYLNQQRLTPNVPYVLRNCAIIQLGSLIARVQFV